MSRTRYGTMAEKTVNIKEYEGKRICVIGCGKSGIGAASFLKKLGGIPFLYDENEKLTLEDVKAKLPQDLQEIRILLGALPDEVLEETDLMVPSPGVPTDTPLMERFRNRNISIYGEIEIAYRMDRGNVMAITGTNGKTTTTTLVGEIMKAAGKKTFVVGNIGTPYTDKVLESDGDSVSVIEVSSFQLETIRDFHPTVSAVLNVTPDHLNRHHTMEAYGQAKAKIFANQTESGYLVINKDDERCFALAETAKAKIIPFSIKEKLEQGAFLDGDMLVLVNEQSLTVIL